MKIGRNERGFTLIELMVVLIIIGILAAIAIPLMSKQTDKAKIKRAVSELKSMKTIVDIYMTDPAVNAAGVAPAATAADLGKVLSENGVTQLTDPWGNGYIYVRGADPFKTYILYSTGSTDAGDEIRVTNATNPEERVTEATAGVAINALP